MAGKHGTEGGKAEEEHLHQSHAEQPHDQSAHIHMTFGRLRQKGQQEHHQVRPDKESQTRQKIGQKQSLPPDGQSVHQAGGAVIVQVRPHGAGRQQRKYDGHGQPRQNDCSHYDPLGKENSRIIIQDQVHRQHEQPNDQIQSPDGPKPGHVLLKQRPVKPRFRGPHSPHLPVHR